MFMYRLIIIRLSFELVKPRAQMQFHAYWASTFSPLGLGGLHWSPTEFRVQCCVDSV